MICARRLSPRDRGPGEDAAITCMEGISVPHRESRAHLGSRGSPVPLDCMRPDGAWAHACCRHGECAYGSRTYKDLGRLHGHAPFVPDGPEKMESMQHCIEIRQMDRNSHMCANPNANLVPLICLNTAIIIYPCRARDTLSGCAFDKATRVDH